MAGATLSEPQVLAHTKRRLFPDEAEQDACAVVDTQFATSTWLHDDPLPATIREELAPFNHVKIGSGYPDLVGVRLLDAEYLAVERFGEEPPLIAVEAKEYTDSGTVDIERGIVQAYDRLHEANAAYVSGPRAAISPADRTLARELTVGVLGVESDGEVAPLEVPRVVGNRTSDEASAIRFQASAQGVADKSFSLNHPKNYLAYPLVVSHSDETEATVEERVVGASDGARRGASFLGVIEERPEKVELTPLGRGVVRFALDRYGSVDDALDVFREWKGSRKRFCELAPEWGLVTRRVVWAYPATQLLVEELQTMHDDWVTTPSLVEWFHTHHSTFTIELFLRGTDDVRSRVLTEDGSLRRAELTDGNVYHSPTVFQLRTMLYRAGILESRGREPSKLDPTADEWTLRNPLNTHR